MNFVAAMLILARLPIELTGYVVNILRKDGSILELPSQIPTATIDLPHESADKNSNICISEKREKSTHYLSEEEALAVETDVFAMMMTLSDKDEKFGMSTLWCPSVPKMKLRVYQMDRLS